MQWVVAGDALRPAGILVFNTNGISCNMETEESFDAFLCSESVTFVRDNQHSQIMSPSVHLSEIGSTVSSLPHTQHPTSANHRLPSPFNGNGNVRNKSVYEGVFTASREPRTSASNDSCNIVHNSISPSKVRDKSVSEGVSTAALDRSIASSRSANLESTSDCQSPMKGQRSNLFTSGSTDNLDSMHDTSDLSSRSDECVSEPPIVAASVSTPVRLVSTTANLLISIYNNYPSEPV